MRLLSCRASVINYGISSKLTLEVSKNVARSQQPVLKNLWSVEYNRKFETSNSQRNFEVDRWDLNKTSDWDPQNDGILRATEDAIRNYTWAFIIIPRHGNPRRYSLHESYYTCSPFFNFLEHLYGFDPYIWAKIRKMYFDRYFCQNLAKYIVSLSKSNREPPHPTHPILSILGMGSANVMSSLIGWTLTQNDSSSEH